MGATTLPENITATENKSTRAGFGSGLLQLGRLNPNVVGLTADLGAVRHERCTAGPSLVSCWPYIIGFECSVGY